MQKTESNFLFTTEHLGIRALETSDYENYLALESNPEVKHFYPGQHHVDPKRVKKNIERNIYFYKKIGFGVFVMVELATGKFIGRCGFGPTESGELEVGYLLMPEFWGKGLATELLKGLLAWADHHILSASYILSYTPVQHTASQRVMQKAGMKSYRYDIVDGDRCIFYRHLLRSKKQKD